MRTFSPGDAWAVIYFKLVLVAVLWGGTFIAGRNVGGILPPETSALIRFIFASLAFVIVTLVKRPAVRLSRENYFNTFVLGLSGIFSYNICFFRGLEQIGAGRAAVIVALNPTLITVVSAAVLGERLTLGKVWGTLIALAGAVLVISDGDPHTVFANGVGSGELWICGCVLSWVTYSVFGKVAMKRDSPFVLVLYSTLIGTLMLVPVGVRSDLGSALKSLPFSAWLGLVYLGVFGTTLAFLWYYQGIRKIGASRASLFINLVPVTSVILAYFVFGEALTLSLLLGGILVVGGLLATRIKFGSGSRRRPAVDHAAHAGE